MRHQPSRHSRLLESALRIGGVLAIVLGLLSLGFVIPKAGRNLFTEIAGTGAFWKTGILLVVVGLALLRSIP